jgi:Protein of unknown function (DUF4232)
MNRWRTIILGTLAAAAMAGCGTSRPAAAGLPSPAPQTGAAGTTTTAAGTTAATTAAVIYLTTSREVPFTGDVVTLRAQAAAGPGSSRWLRLASVTISFGDGSAGSASQPCSGGGPGQAARGLAVRHAYRRAGLFTARVTSARICGRAGHPDLAGVASAMRVLPTAPPASASWPLCRPGQVRVTARGTGAGLGHVGVLFTVRNVSATHCRLLGYAGLRLLSRAGRRLPTTVHHATSGAYLFPPVAPHRVALRPGGYAAFELQYGDNPAAAQASEPYAKACPAASRAEVTLPGDRSFSVVSVAMAPCGGGVWISPLFPGRQWIVFP